MTDPALGWSGTDSRLQHFLRTMGADRDERGRWLVAGTVALFMGVGPDVVVGADARYFVGGRPHGLALDLRGTSYGMGIVVI